MASRIPIRIHKFWQRIAVVGGVYFLLDGVLSIIFYREQALINHIPRIIRAGIGLLTIFVDYWFLKNI